MTGDTRQLRHALHALAERSMEEKKTRAFIRRFLEENTSLEILETESFLAAVKHPDGEEELPAIAFRAELDALPVDETIALPYASETPGVSHKCGHDGHMAALLGFAKRLDGRHTAEPVYLFFQPGEETGSGGKGLADALESFGISKIFAFHNRPGYPKGTIVLRSGLMQCASMGLSLTMTGKASHASEPQNGKNPAEALSVLLLYALSLPKAEMGDMVTPVGLNIGGADFGVSPGIGTLNLTVRARSVERMENLAEKIREKARQQAGMDGLTLDVRALDVFPETVNDSRCAGLAEAAAAMLTLPILRMEEPWTASEDFGHCLQKVPGALFYIGDGENWPDLHTSAYDFPDDILETAEEMMEAILDLCEMAARREGRP